MQADPLALASRPALAPPANPPSSASTADANSQPCYALATRPLLTPAVAKPSQPPPELPPGVPPIGLDGYCPVKLIETQRWVRGDPRWGAIHRSRTYLFTGPEEQRRFLADHDAYAPVMSGNDIVVKVEHNEQVAGHREHGVFCDGKVYLFASEDSLQKFNRAPARYIAEVQQVLRLSSFQR